MWPPPRWRLKRAPRPLEVKKKNLHKRVPERMPFSKHGMPLKKGTKTMRPNAAAAQEAEDDVALQFITVESVAEAEGLFEGMSPEMREEVIQETQRRVNAEIEARPDGQRTLRHFRARVAFQESKGLLDGLTPEIREAVLQEAERIATEAVEVVAGGKRVLRAMRAEAAEDGAPRFIVLLLGDFSPDVRELMLEEAVRQEAEQRTAASVEPHSTGGKGPTTRSKAAAAR